MNVTLAILNRNDVEGCRVVIPQIDRSLFSEIFVVDGNSTDGSQEFFATQNITCFKDITGGRGGAMRFAIAKASGTHLIFLSSDGEEDPKDLPKITQCFAEDADMVIASRLAKGAYHKGQAHWYYLHRLLYLKLITFLINILFKANLTDCWNGYRGFKLEAVRAVPTDAQDFMIEAQQTIRFLKAGYKVVEFPTHEGERVAGQSSNPVLKSGFLHFIMIFQEWLKK